MNEVPGSGPQAAGAGLFGSIEESFARSPLAMSPMSFASCMGSRGRFGRLAMGRVSHEGGLAGYGSSCGQSQIETLPAR